MRKHWEYSTECFNIIEEYLDKYPEAIEAIEYSCKAKKDKAMHTLKDLYPDIGEIDKEEAISRLKGMLHWIENLPISKLPYVEMGFDALDTNLVHKLQSHNEHVTRFYEPINLNVSPVETLKIMNIYQEAFPFWCGPYY